MVRGGRCYAGFQNVTRNSSPLVTNAVESLRVQCTRTATSPSPEVPLTKLVSELAGENVTSFSLKPPVVEENRTQ